MQRAIVTLASGHPPARFHHLLLRTGRAPPFAPELPTDRAASFKKELQAQLPPPWPEGAERVSSACLLTASAPNRHSRPACCYCAIVSASPWPATLNASPAGRLSLALEELSTCPGSFLIRTIFPGAQVSERTWCSPMVAEPICKGSQAGPASRPSPKASQLSGDSNSGLPDRFSAAATTTTPSLPAWFWSSWWVCRDSSLSNRLHSGGSIIRLAGVQRKQEASGQDLCQLLSLPCQLQSRLSHPPANRPWEGRRGMIGPLHCSTAAAVMGASEVSSVGLSGHVALARGLADCDTARNVVQFHSALRSFREQRCNPH